MSTPDRQEAISSPQLSASELAEVAPFGVERPVAAGELLFEAGEASYDLFVVLEGAVEVVRSNGADEVVVAQFGPGNFVGELTLLTGQRRFLTGRVTQSGRVLVVEQSEFRRLMSTLPALADTIFSALVARRELLRSGEGAQAIRIVGSRYSPEAMSLRSFAEHSRLPYAWIDLEEADDVDTLLQTMGLGPQDTPVVITPTEILRRPSSATFAEHLGLTFQPTPGYIFDLVVVGSGPAGLAAAVYGASEGLHTVMIEREAPGGQAGLSSRIENYLGFPVGLTGEDLARRGVQQARRFGVEILSPQEVTGVRVEGPYRYIKLADGTEISCNALLLAMGVQWRSLDVPGMERLQGAGVYYGGGTSEALSCKGETVYIVGGANSAGQAAMHFSKFAAKVVMLIRGASLTSTMSYYLIEQIEKTPNIAVWNQSSVVGVYGEMRLECIAVQHADTGVTEQLPASSLFIFIGAQPRTEWLDGVVMRDKLGFVLSGPDVVVDGKKPKSWTLDREPGLLETSVPGIFAVGDVRHGSVKRVASGVGEGAVVVQFIHQYLAKV